MLLLILYLILAIGVSFLCSIMEAVLLSVPPSYLSVEAKKSSWAKRMLGYKKSIDKPLAAILSLNTIAHTVGAAGVGAQAVKVFGEAYFGIISAILTLLILLCTEIVPKTIGALYWRKICKATLYLIRGTIVICYPLVMLASLLTRFIAGEKSPNKISREEIKAIAAMAKKEGVLSEDEGRFVSNVLQMRNTLVEEIMTPRPVICMTSDKLTVAEFCENLDRFNFSRIPLYTDNRETLEAFVLKQEVLQHFITGKADLKLNSLGRPLLKVPTFSRTYVLLEKLLSRKEHMAAVINEYGGIEGIVTLEDVLEHLLGKEILDESDEVSSMRELARRKRKP